MVEIIERGWALIVALVGFVAWLARLEGRAISNSEAIRRETVDREKELIALEKRFVEQRAEDRSTREKEHADLKEQIADTRRDFKDGLAALRADLRAILRGEKD